MIADEGQERHQILRRIPPFCNGVIDFSALSQLRINYSPLCKHVIVAMVAELGAIRLREKEVLPNELLLGRERFVRELVCQKSGVFAIPEISRFIQYCLVSNSNNATRQLE